MMDTADVEMLLDTAERYFRGSNPMADRVAAFKAGNVVAPGGWTALADMGWLGLTVSPEDGGFGAPPSVALALARLSGRDARPEWLDLHLMVAPLIAGLLPADERERFAAGLADGSIRLGVGDGRLEIAGEQGDADVRLTGRELLIYGAVDPTDLFVEVGGRGNSAGIGWIKVDAAGVRLAPARLVDGRSVAMVGLDQGRARLLAGQGDGALAAARLRDLIAAGLVADALGVLEAAFELTGDYLKQRVQFGRPLSAQQVVQHRMADIFCDLQQFASLFRRLQTELDGAPEGPWTSLPVAKAFVGRRVLRAAGQLIQLSGGIGMTEEYRLSHYYRRLHVAATLFGDVNHQLGRVDAERMLAA
jgi:alkylation response protein AidB-like acyl-CoA dehydrogenase